jgi:DNA-binding response OmpR family regulator
MDGTLKKVLIVEDEKPLAHALDMKLKNAGFETTVAVNGNEALDALENSTPDLIVLNLIMPQLDGFGFLEEIKKRSFHTPVIVYSDLEQEEDRKRALGLGAKDYVVKSSTPLSVLVDNVTKQLNKS